MSLRPTASQTAGPFLAIGLAWEDGPFVVAEGTHGAITVRGRVLDLHGAAVDDALVETWQADPEGRFDHPDDPRGAVARADGFRGFGRCLTDAEGWWHVVTLKPGPLPTPDGGLEAPHLDLSIFARGLLDRVVTRLYFDDEERANAADPVLSALPADRRSTLIASSEPGGYRLDIRLRGERETVFFAV